MLTKKDGGALSARVELPQRLEAPVAQGQTVGRVVVEKQGELLGEYEYPGGGGCPGAGFCSRMETFVAQPDGDGLMMAAGKNSPER